MTARSTRASSQSPSSSTILVESSSACSNSRCCLSATRTSWSRTWTGSQRVASHRWKDTAALEPEQVKRAKRTGISSLRVSVGVSRAGSASVQCVGKAGANCLVAGVARDHRLDRCQRDLDWFVVPETQDCPSRRLECGCLLLVSPDIALELGWPVAAVDLGHPAVFWAAVPKTAVDEHSHLAPREGDVRPDELAVGPDWEIFAEAVAPAMQRRT